MQRNTATTLKVFAFNRTTNAPVIGDAANLSCKVSIDGGARVALVDTTATELEDGYYIFDVSASETNGSTVDFFPESTTSNVVVITANMSRYTSFESQIKAKTDLITATNVTYTSPVSSTGAIRAAIIIGDDYLAANARAFEWTISARTGVTVSTASCRFGGSNAELGKSWLVTGTVSDLGAGQWKLSFDLSKTVTGALLEGYYRWSVEIVSAGGTEVTEVYSGRNVEVRAKQT